MTYRYNLQERENWGYLDVDSVHTPDFAAKKAAGEDLPVNAHRWHWYASSHPVDYSSPWHPNGLTYRESAGLVQDLYRAVSVGHITDMVGTYVPVQRLDHFENEVRIRLLKKARNVELNLGVTLGEFGETVDLVVGALRTVRRSYKDLRRGKPASALKTLLGFRKEARRRGGAWTRDRPDPPTSIRDTPGVLSDKWLTYSLGLRPLLKDVESAVKVLDGQIRTSPRVFTLNTHMRKDVNVNRVWYYGHQDGVQGTLTCSGRMRIRVSDPFLYTLSQLGLTDPVTVAWELVPFSFVVDWFVPVGEYLEAIQPPQGVDFVDGYLYSKVFGKSHHKSGAPVTTASTAVIRKLRTPLTDWPTVKLVVPDLSLKKTQLATGMALLHQLATGQRSPRR